MSIKDFNKVINVQDGTTGDVVRVLRCSDDSLVTTTLKLCDLELCIEVLDLLKNERGACVTVGYKN